MTTFTNRPLGIGVTSEASMLGIGSSSVLLWCRTSSVPVASLRSLARIQPFWTNVSLPSGRTSLTVAWRSTSGVDERTQRSTAPGPMTAVSPDSGAETYETAVPDGFCSQLHCHWEALPHNPPPPVLLP